LGITNFTGFWGHRKGYWEGYESQGIWAPIFESVADFSESFFPRIRCGMRLSQMQPKTSCLGTKRHFLILSRACWPKQKKHPRGQDRKMVLSCSFVVLLLDGGGRVTREEMGKALDEISERYKEKFGYYPDFCIGYSVESMVEKLEEAMRTGKEWKCGEDWIPGTML